MNLQEIIALAVVVLAAAYLIRRAFTKRKSGCDCCGCHKPGKIAQR